MSNILDLTLVDLVESIKKKEISSKEITKTYIERCNFLSSNPPEGEWNGVWVMTSK